MLRKNPERRPSVSTLSLSFSHNRIAIIFFTIRKILILQRRLKLRVSCLGYILRPLLDLINHICRSPAPL